MDDGGRKNVTHHYQQQASIFARQLPTTVDDLKKAVSSQRTSRSILGAPDRLTGAKAKGTTAREGESGNSVWWSSLEMTLKKGRRDRKRPT